MKLYTELQVIEAIGLSHSTDDSIRSILKQFTPIELPSNEEIAEKIASTVDASEYGKLVYAGALWMLEQIKQQYK